MVETNSRDGVTELLVRWNDGDLAARDTLIPLVYDELRRVAKRNLAGQRSDHTLQATALVHEAYLRLVNRKAANWQGRVHFFALAAQMMRQILVDHARMRNAAKRGGGAFTLQSNRVVRAFAVAARRRRCSSCLPHCNDRPSIKRNRVHSKDTRVLSTSVQLRQNTSGVNDLATDARLAIQLPSPSRSGTPQPLQPRRPNECEFQPDYPPNPATGVLVGSNCGVLHSGGRASHCDCHAGPPDTRSFIF